MVRKRYAPDGSDDPQFFWQKAQEWSVAVKEAENAAVRDSMSNADRKAAKQRAAKTPKPVAPVVEPVVVPVPRRSFMRRALSFIVGYDV